MLCENIPRNVLADEVAAIDAQPPFVLSLQLFEGETSFESPAVHLAAGGEFRIKSRVG